VPHLPRALPRTVCMYIHTVSYIAQTQMHCLQEGTSFASHSSIIIKGSAAYPHRPVSPRHTPERDTYGERRTRQPVVVVQTEALNTPTESSPIPPPSDAESRTGKQTAKDARARPRAHHACAEAFWTSQPTVVWPPTSLAPPHTYYRRPRRGAPLLRSTYPRSIIG